MKTKRYHNIVDLDNCNEKINDKEFMRKFVQELATTVEMNILEGPIVAEGFDYNPGLSALAIVDFSHISIHTFSKYNEALIDIFSCKAYDREKVVKLCLDTFATAETKTREKEVCWGE
jgi:S-adenosylmethionine decarboxylase